MGWRTHEAYDRAEEERERAWLASLSPGQRLRVRAGQFLGILLVVAPRRRPARGLHRRVRLLARRFGVAQLLAALRAADRGRRAVLGAPAAQRPGALALVGAGDRRARGGALDAAVLPAGLLSLLRPHLLSLLLDHDDARALVAEGAEVVLSGFGDAREIALLCTELNAIHVGGDLSKREGVEELMSEAGPVDILVNNAGMQHVAPIEEFPVEKWDMIIALNLTAAFDTARLAVPYMKQAGWGRIINIASAHSLTASPYKSAYVAAKHGLSGLTKTLALELATDGVTANCISPGYVWTPLVENQIPDTMVARNMTREQVIEDVMLVRQPTRKFVQPSDIGEMAVFLCRDAASNINGSNISMDGGWTAE